MAYRIREALGWLLILAGLSAFWLAYTFLLNKRLFEASPIVFIGFVVFRGGIHILKVSVAAQAARELPDLAPSNRRSSSTSVRQVGPTPLKRILPGPQQSDKLPTRK